VLQSQISQYLLMSRVNVVMNMVNVHLIIAVVNMVGVVSLMTIAIFLKVVNPNSVYVTKLPHQLLPLLLLLKMNQHRLLFCPNFINFLNCDILCHFIQNLLYLLKGFICILYLLHSARSMLCILRRTIHHRTKIIQTFI